MSKKQQNKTTQVIHDFRVACSRLAELINLHLFDGCRNWWWVGNEIGGFCCFEDNDFLTPEQMVLILEEGVTYDQYEEWNCANLDNQDKGYINLYSWLRGCRHDILNKKTYNNGRTINRKA